jgi:hypothetical protein
MPDEEILFYIRLFIWLMFAGMIASGLVSFILIIVSILRLLF